MRGLAITCAVLLACLSLAGCPAEKSTGTDEAKPASSTGPDGLLLTMARPGTDKQEEIVARVRERLDAFERQAVVVQAEGDKGILLTLPGAADKGGLDRLQELLFEVPKLDISPVETAEAYFAELKKKLPARGGFRVGVDKFGDKRFDKMVAISYVAADDKDALQAFIEKAKVPEKKRLALMSGAKGAIAYLLPDPPPIGNCKLFNVRIERDEEGKVQSVAANLAKPFLQDFKDLIDVSLHRPVAVLVNGQVRAMPVIWKRRSFGDLHFLPSILAEPEQIEQEAKQLAGALRNLALLGRLKVVSKRVGS